ncbi:MAG: transglutaminase domain-containing protein [Desulfobacterales bacterium]|nr:transglutaminase domain-containing protein [Desulfobacterales bacterium]
MNKTPPLLLGASLVFWGWQTGMWFFAVIMAIAVESTRFVSIKWEITLSDFSRISDLCTVIFLVIVVFLFATKEPIRVVFIALQWLPMCYFPLIVSQEYSAAGKVDIRALSLMLRKKGNKKGNKSAPVFINLSYPFFALCILSASMANVRSIWFYASLMLLSAWAIWPVRSKRFSPVLWMCTLALAGFCGYSGHIGLNRLQSVVEQKGMEWFFDYNRDDADPYQTITAIGDIRNIKLSDKILFRVRPENSDRQPFLLRETSYNSYRYSRWFALDADFIPVQPERNMTTWKLRNSLKSDLKIGKAEKVLTVSAPLKKGRGILKLPIGTSQIEQLPVLKMEYNRFGAVKVDEGPGLANYKVRFSTPDKKLPGIDGLPGIDDLFVPDRELPAINRIIKELDIPSKTPQDILKTLYDYFQNNFKYSLTLKKKKGKSTPLSDFLFRTHAGHCEYFATATVLILRTSGIPARYATGFSVHEFSKLENSFVVRDRDAHAWTLVYTDGVWQDFDTTTSAWMDIEADAASPLQVISDLWAWVKFGFSKWRWSGKKGRTAKYIAWLLIPLIIILARSLYVNKQIKRVKTGQAQKKGELPIPGTDSEFYLIEERLNKMGYPRYPGETLSGWLKRIEKSEQPDISVSSLDPVLSLHYRYRFDPEGISLDEKTALESDVHLWLENN